MRHHEGPTRFDLPEPGDLVWCWFPEDARLQPAPKPRPALVLATGHDEDDECLPIVCVAAGTSRKTGRGEVFTWELLIEDDGSDSFRASGLGYTTKFNVRNTLELPYTSDYFEPPPRRPFGGTPKLGMLHAHYMKRLRAAVASR